MTTNFNCDFIFSAEEPVAVYPLDDCSQATDSASSKSNGEIIGDYLATEGPNGRLDGAISFRGSSLSYIKIKKTEVLNTKYSLSIFMHVYFDVLNQKASLLSFGEDGQVSLFIQNRNLIFLAKDKKESLFDNSVSYRLPNSVIGKWSFIGASYDYTRSTFSLFVNNRKVRSIEVSIREPDTDNDIYINRVKTGNFGGFKGRISCLKLYDRILNPDEFESASSCKSSK